MRTLRQVMLVLGVAGSVGGGRRRVVAVVVGSLCGLVVGAWPAAGTALAVPHIYWGNNSGSDTIGEASLDGTAVNQSFIAVGTARYSSQRWRSTASTSIGPPATVPPSP